MKLKKILIICISLVLLLMINTKTVNSVTTSHNDQGQYRFLENVVEKQLHTNVFYKNDIGETKTTIDKTPTGATKNAAGSEGGGTLNPNIFYKQNINVLEGKTEGGLKVVNWGYTTNSRYVVKNLFNLAQDYEQNHPGWKVIGGMNTDFFDMSAKLSLPYQPLGPMISDGEVIKASGSNNFSLMIGFKNQGLPSDLVVKKYIANAIGLDDLAGPFKLSIYDSNENIIKTFTINKHNAVPGEEEISLYNAKWLQPESGKLNSNPEIIPVQLPTGFSNFIIDEAVKALANNPNDFYGLGVIGEASLDVLTEGQFAIVSNSTEVNEYLSAGVKVRVQRDFIGMYEGIEELTCGHAYLLEDNIESPLLNEDYYFTRAPRSILGIKDDGTIVMLTIDGRQSKNEMFGATQEEMVAVMKHYGCVSAYNLDGGGSTTMIIREGDTFKTVNSPSDGSARTVSNAIFFVVYEPDIESNVVKTERESVEVQLTVNNPNGHDIKELYLKVNDELFAANNNLVKIDSLEPNTEYKYYIYYKDSKDKLHQTILSGKFITAKRMALIKDFKIVKEGENLRVVVSFDDPDKSVTRATVRIGENSEHLNYGAANFKGLELKDASNLLLVVRMDLEDGNGSFETTFKKPGILICNYIDIILSKKNRTIKAILH